MSDELPWTAVSDELPPERELVQTLIPDMPRPRPLVWRDGKWMTITAGEYEGPAPTHWRRTRSKGTMPSRAVGR